MQICTRNKKQKLRTIVMKIQKKNESDSDYNNETESDIDNDEYDE